MPNAVLMKMAQPMIFYVIWQKNVADIMSLSDDKWVLEQVMDIEAPELVQRIQPVVCDVFSLKNS